MFLSRFVPTRDLFNSLTLQTHSFATKSHINKVSLYLQRAKLIDSIRLALRSNSPRSLIPLLNDPSLDSFVVANALRSAPSPDSALSFIETLKTIPHFMHTQQTLHALAKVLAKSQQTAKLKSLIHAINSGFFTNVPLVSFMDRMRWFAAAGELDSVISVWDEWRALQKRPSAESYNILMGLYAQMGKNAEAVKIFHMMIDEGVVPNSRMYTVMIEHLLNAGKLDEAMQIFGILPLMRIKRTLSQYFLLARAFTDTKRFDVVKSLLSEMRTDGILPSRAMQWSLQRMQEEGFLEETDEFIKEMLPDERIKNIGVSLDDNDDDDDDGNNDVACANSDADVNGVQLRPWLDPAALATALRNWAPEEVSALEEAKFIWTSRLVCKMIRSFKSAETAWKFFCWVSHQPGFTHDVHTVSRMLPMLARKGRVDLVDELIVEIKREGIRLSCSTIRSLIDLYGISATGHAALKIFRDAKTLCGQLSNNSQLLLYSSLLRTLAKSKMNSEVLDILDEMILGGFTPDVQTFSGLMNHFAVEADIKMVQRLSGMVRQSSLEPDGYMCKVLIRAYCNCGRAVLALRVFEDMMKSQLLPDTATKELLVKSLWKEGKLKEAASVEERSSETNDILPLLMRVHLYTLSSADLSRVCSIYSGCFRTSIE